MPRGTITSGTTQFTNLTLSIALPGCAFQEGFRLEPSPQFAVLHLRDRLDGGFKEVLESNCFQFQLA